MYEVKSEFAKNGQMTILIDGKYIHSKYNPTKETQQIVQSKYKAHHLHIVFGYGCGYIVDELINIRKFNEPILVIDPLVDKGIIEFFHSNCESIYFSKANDINEMSILVSKLISYDGRLVLINDANYTSLFLNEYKDILKAIRKSQYTEVANVNTVNLFSKEWQLNLFLNNKNIVTDNNITDLKKVYKCPIVIAAGGPSLTKQLALLEQYRDKMILICAGSTINTLLNVNIEPDYVVSIDGGEANYNHFKDLRLKKAELIYNVMHHYKINDSFIKKGFPFVPTSKPQVQKNIKERFNKDISLVNGGGSVAHYALEIAKLLTTGPIALIGQDLAYTNNYTHAIGNKSNVEVKCTEKLLEIEGYNGEVVQTSVSLYTMLSTFEQLQNFSPHENEVYNCTEGGAKIKGYTQKPFADFLNAYAIGEVKCLNLEETESLFDEKEYYKMELYEYEKLIDLLKQGESLVKFEKGPLFKTHTLKKLNDIDKKLNRKYEYLELNTLLESTLLAAEKKYLPKIDETPKDQFERVKAYTLDLYGQCRKVIEDYKETIEKIIAEQEELKDVTK